MKEDATKKKFLVSQFNNYQMREHRPIMEQFNEIERILGHFEMHNMNMDETIIVSSTTDYNAILIHYELTFSQQPALLSQTATWALLSYPRPGNSTQ